MEDLYLKLKNHPCSSSSRSSRLSPSMLTPSFIRNIYRRKQSSNHRSHNRPLRFIDEIKELSAEVNSASKIKSAESLHTSSMSSLELMRSFSYSSSLTNCNIVTSPGVREAHIVYFLGLGYNDLLTDCWRSINIPAIL